MTCEGASSEKVEAVKRHVANAATCNAATVASLRIYLSQETPAVRSVRQSATQKQAKLPKKEPLKGLRKRENNTNRNLNGDFIVKLSRGEQQRLVTEVVNVVLKSFTQSIASQVSAKSWGSRRTKSTSCIKNAPCSQNQTVESSPLRAISGNVISKSSRQGKVPRDNVASASGSEPRAGLEAQAQCGHIALASLGSIEGLAKRCGRQLNNQVDNAMSAFIGKLVSLELYEIALKELRTLHRRLVAQCQSENEASVITSSEVTAPDKSKPQPLADLLHISNAFPSEQVLSLAITTQLQVVKLLVRYKSSENLKAALEHLRPESLYSPFALIELAMTSEKPDVSTLAACRLDSLARAVSSLYDGFRPLTSETSCPGFTEADPLLRLQYHALLIQIKVRAYKLANHVGQMDKELLRPFLRSLDVVRSQAKQLTGDKYGTIEAATHVVLEACGIVLQEGNEPPTSTGSTIQPLCQCLMEIASGCGLVDKKVTWASRGYSFAEQANSSSVCSCTWACRVVVSHLDASPERSLNSFNDKDTDPFSRLIRCLSGDLRGDSVELDDLLVSMSSLRRALLPTIDKIYQSQSSDDDQRETISICIETLSLCIKYLARYSGQSPASATDATATKRFQQRRDHAASVAPYFVESIVLCAEKLQLESDDAWANLDLGLQRCMQVLRNIELCDESCISPASHIRSVRLIVELYWRRLIAVQYGQIRHAQSFFSLFQNWQRPEGFLDVYLRKVRDYGQAASCKGHSSLMLRQSDAALDAYLGSDDFRAAVRQASVSHPREVWSVNTLRQLASQLLMIYSEIASKSMNCQKGHELIYDYPSADPSARGLILELQLSSLLSQAKGVVDKTAEFHKAITHTVDLLLSLYTPSRFPLRRLRVVNRVQAAQTLRSEVYETLATNMGCADSDLCKVDATSDDVGLERFGTHLLISQDVWRILWAPSPSIEVLEKALIAWQEYFGPSEEGFLLDRIDSVSDWCEQLECIASYFAKEGCIRVRCSALDLLRRASEIDQSRTHTSLFQAFIELSRCSIALGKIEQASLNLLRAQKLLKDFADDDTLTLMWQVSSAQYFLALGDLQQCRVLLTEARRPLGKLSKPEGDRKKARSKECRHRLVLSDYYHTMSALAEAEGDHLDALLYARFSAKTLSPIWTRAMQDRINSSAETLTTGPGHSPVPDSAIPSPIQQSSKPGERRQERRLAWLVGPKFFESVISVGRFYSYMGLFTETQYFAEQGWNIAKVLAANQWIVRADAFRNHVMNTAGQRDQEFDSWNSVSHGALCPQVDTVTAILQLANAAECLGDQTRAEKCYIQAKELLNPLEKEASAPAHKPSCQAPSADLTAQLADLSLVDHDDNHRKRPCARQSGLSNVQASNNSLSSNHRPKSFINTTLLTLRAEILQGQASLALKQGLPGRAQTLLDEIESSAIPSAQLAVYNCLLAESQVDQTLMDTSNDLIFGILADSAVALPSLIATVAGQGIGSSRRIAPCKSSSTKSRTVRKKNEAATDIREVYNETAHKLALTLEAALRRTNIAWQHSQRTSSTRRLLKVARVFTKIVLLLSSIKPPRSSLAQQQQTTFVEGLSRIVAISRTRQAIRIEKLLLSSPRDFAKWPHCSPIGNAIPTQSHDGMEALVFQQQFLDIIPQPWLVMSIRLNDRRDKLQIAKLHKDHAPFVLSIPLQRQSIHDPEDEDFGFEQVQQKLQEIMQGANLSAQNAGDKPTKAGLKLWWAERARLDSELKVLLTNIECIWLGGFRGIFSAQPHDPDLLDRFQQSMQKILDNHLPSRQKSGNATKAPRMKLEIPVLELFVELGNPNDGSDIDEPLMDLLYFTIDALQFHGECNAYDEVDFDAVIIEVTDALRQFHEAAKRQPEEQKYQHTILILDKGLHAIPWESLDCLRERSISRLPSLQCLRERILQQQGHAQVLSSDDNTSAGYSVRRSNGAYILNPSGDLKHTQAQFEGPLQEFFSWDGVVDQVPSESEMTGFLASKDILLYFGHGSGSQFIRRRSIMGLEQCAVTLLMGCSSGTMTEAGEFESYGTPIDYINAGAPALVATLWDVTDKDIDRFSMTLLQEWGLFKSRTEIPTVGQTGSNPDQRLKGRGKGKEAPTTLEARTPKSAVSLCEAVAIARESCTTKYLNGAAPVVYGVPVFVAD